MKRKEINRLKYLKKKQKKEDEKRKAYRSRVSGYSSSLVQWQEHKSERCRS